MVDQQERPNEEAQGSHDIREDLEPTQEAAANVIGGRDPDGPVIGEMTILKPADR